MERATKQQMLKNYYGAWMQPNELKVLRQYRSGTSVKHPRHPCEFDKMSKALSQAREDKARTLDARNRRGARGSKKSVKFNNSRDGFDERDSQFSISSIKSRKSIKAFNR